MFVSPVLAVPFSFCKSCSKGIGCPSVPSAAVCSFHAAETKLTASDKTSFIGTPLKLRFSLRRRCGERHPGRHDQRLLIRCSEGLQQTQERELQETVVLKVRRLQSELEQAIQDENYQQAAALHDEIERLSEQDPLLRIRRLKAEMEIAATKEDYDEAVRLRDEILSINPNGLEIIEEPEVQELQISPTSDTLTKGVRVKVKSFLVPNRSSPDDNYYFFAYQITISNEGSETVQLLSRHWAITDADNRVEHVRGPGVVGEQPVLEPGKSFEYTSACPIQLSRRLLTGEIAGSMKGTYQMISESGATFDAAIGAFGLVA
mmetsp:Transcript_9607/g.16582  ORF Transcript_9607/g.16582 Transcript_9607/m.16582 type:complete len:318 (+) Transcript_9607:49-1002(+)